MLRSFPNHSISLSKTSVPLGPGLYLLLPAHLLSLDTKPQLQGSQVLSHFTKIMKFCNKELNNLLKYEKKTSTSKLILIQSVSASQIHMCKEVRMHTHLWLQQSKHLNKGCLWAEVHRISSPYLLGAVSNKADSDIVRSRFMKTQSKFRQK